MFSTLCRLVKASLDWLGLRVRRALTEQISEDSDIQLELCNLAGPLGKLKMSTASTVTELQAAIEVVTEVPACKQKLLLGNLELDLTTNVRLSELQLKTGDCITAVAMRQMLAPLASDFYLQFYSSRDRLGLKRYSSAFSIVYKFYGNLPEKSLKFEVWRKNDHDKICLDGKAMVITMQDSHWMSGTREWTRAISGPEPSASFVAAWTSVAESAPLAEPSDRFWLEAAEADRRSQMDKEKQAKRSYREPDYEPERPRYGLMPGWFTLPEEHDLIELVVDFPLPEPHTNTRIVRMLVDSRGTLHRVAITSANMTNPMQSKIEEYDVSSEDTV